MCEMNFSVEIGSGYPKLLIRNGSLGEIVMQIRITSEKQLDNLTNIIYLARQQLAEAQKSEALS
ncbi:hypothetical protein MAF45_10510 [Mesosutterella sp. OilRF-GAM-744-9]|uniref:RNA-binding protein n=1 Tax=Mesosutterella porci TaxID=2915351 RepID=A0ABS9MTB6_9BURK|nr:hypothetical protein [Mesosutterella sp. oilRF-744-WT-GAM-9]MCG5031866.1 hypothetical protein [Mesosutterella sp. oilRF-744-WT-GAM-9]